MSGKGSGAYIVGVDIGGTFTDCVAIAADGEVHVGKVPTRPDDRTGSFFDAIADAAAGFAISLEELLSACIRLVHATTTGTNALITRGGARIGLITTTGHGDAVTIMKGFGRLAGLTGDQMFDMPRTGKPEQLVTKAEIAEVVERVDFEGDVLVALDEASVVRALDKLVGAGVEAVTVSLLWSVRNPAHEQRIVELARERHPDLFVTAAAELASQVGEYERTMAGVINSYIGPLMNSYVRGLEAGARERGYRGHILFAQCAGGTITAAEAERAPIRTLHSGPVMGTLGGAFLGSQMREPDLIVADMGGTSFDVSVIRGAKPELRDRSVLDRFEVALPMVHVDSVGAGGGSIAWIDPSGGLQVGPHSAGAYPGPACYGRGGTLPTVTDADVVLGVLDPTNFLHGAADLDRDAAERAIATVAKPLGLSIPEAAAGISRLVDSNMADLMRRMSVMRGLDPREFICLAYGGMGPVHAAAVARETGVRRLVIPLPLIAPVWSAFGATVADVIHIHQRPRRLRLPVDAAELNATFAELERDGRQVLEQEGFAPDRVELQRALRMKYTAQVFDVEVNLDSDGEISPDRLPEITDLFAATYERLHGEGAGYPEGGIEITGFVVRALGLAERPRLAGPAVAVAPELSTRQAYWHELGGFVDTAVMRLPGGIVAGDLAGPMLIELPDTVIVLRPGQTGTFAPEGSFLIEL